MTQRRKAAIQYRIAWLLLAIAATIPAYVLWPVDLTTLPPDEAVAVTPDPVHPGQTIRWIRPGETCFPDGWVLVRQTVEATLPDGSQFNYPDTGPKINRNGACVTDNVVDWQLPVNFAIPGPFRVRFDFCSNPGQVWRERCVTTYSPTYVLELPKE